MTLREWKSAVLLVGCVTVVFQVFAGCFPATTHETMTLAGWIGGCAGTAWAQW